jgi:hypothetical protein
MPPTTLIKRLKDRAGKDVIVVPHHLPLYKWWIYPKVDPEEMDGPLPALHRGEIDTIQPVAEVYSRAHGMNESQELKDWIKPPTTFGNPLYDTFWQDGLMEGVKAGAMCSGDNHGSGLGHALNTALTAVLASSLSREGIFRAIQKRRTYGTSGPRLFIDFRIGEAKMGDIITLAAGSSPPTLEASVVSPLPIDIIEVVKVTYGFAEVTFTKPAEGNRECAFSWTDTAHDPSRWVCYYLRIHLDDDSHGAWTSPIWLEPFLREIPKDPMHNK